MRRGRWCGAILVTVMLAGGAPSPVPAAEVGPGAVVAAYIEAVQHCAWEEARDLWSVAYLADAAALGITYTDVPCSWDLASPVILDRVDGITRTYRVEPRGADPDQGLVVVTPTTGDPGTGHVYGLVREGGTWRLADRTWLAGRTWPTRTTRYCTLRGPGVARLDDLACDELDRFVADCARSLGAPEARLAELARVRIPYYVVDDATVVELTGHRTKGMANLAAGAVISSHFPHFHELAHLLVNWVLADLPLRTHPLLQEGLACLLGGRWGRASRVILYTGWFQLDLGLGEVADVLTWNGFHTAAGGADGSYALAALVCDLVHDRAGWHGLRQLYTTMSGPLDRLQGARAPVVARTVGEVCGLAGDDPVAALTAAVTAHAARWRRCGIEPGAGPAPDTTVLRLESDHGRLEVQPAGGRWTVRLQASSYPRAVVLAMAGGDGGPDPGTGSPLFTEQWPDRTWDGSRWGLVCRPESVGLYDYVTNRLVATWVADFSGEPPLGAGDPAWLAFTVDVPAELAAVPPGELRIGLD